MIHASTGEHALAWCKRHVADVLVTDVRLPGQVDGCSRPNLSRDRRSPDRRRIRHLGAPAPSAESTFRQA
ncbi:hypothetical protein [Bradyrhizobium tunisiense]|uniref:hypothetical protein n=1 Tax=Bradyrhizobium tunisiense TaxID=3278709 RepID=UPI0035D7C661